MTDEEFWDSHSLLLPKWYLASNEVALITPSSATCERLFSLLTQGFDKSQRSALEDYKLASTLMRFNNTGQNHHA